VKDVVVERVEAIVEIVCLVALNDFIGTLVFGEYDLFATREAILPSMLNS
jgi:hypothetical protein